MQQNLEILMQLGIFIFVRISPDATVITSVHFCDVLRESLRCLRIGSHLRNTCRRLRIVAVRRCPVQVIKVFSTSISVSLDV